jgi:hypothetical protein
MQRLIENAQRWVTVLAIFLLSFLVFFFFVVAVKKGSTGKRDDQLDSPGPTRQWLVHSRVYTLLHCKFNCKYKI